MVLPFLPPAINGLSQFGGFSYQLLDQSGGPIEDLAAAAQQIVAQGNQTPGLTGLFTQFTANDPQLLVNIDREQAKSLGVSLGDITGTLQVLLGSSYVNDFDFNNRSYRVYVQADQQFRAKPQDIERYYVRSADRQMMPLSNIVKVDEATAPKTINHYNLFRSVEIVGSPAPGYSSGQALQIMEGVSSRTLPQGMTFSWSGVSLEEIEAGAQIGGHLRPRPAARLPDAGGPVRKRDAAVHHPAVGAARRPRRADRPVRARAASTTCTARSAW